MQFLNHTTGIKKIGNVGHDKEQGRGKNRSNQVIVSRVHWN